MPLGSISVFSAILLAQVTMADIVFTLADQGSVRKTETGQSVLVQLPETPSTGYRWSLNALPNEAIEIIESRWIAPARAGAGSSGTREFLLRVKAPGEIRLDFRLLRDWLGESSTIERCEFTLRVS
jgi:inhibitor of cysteine peptidase